MTERTTDSARKRELKVLHLIVKHLDALEEEERGRILAWLIEAYGSKE